ncbi:MAG: cupredoxin domain-containing protein, partial [Chloroflexota bacterium]|nr:cupredoxin domain-containing protein [Chloroflexota bacterium]
DVKAAQPKAAASTAAAAAGGPQVVEIHSTNINFNLDKVNVKAGQPVQFKFTNGDDEKHNLVGIGEGLNLLSPDVPAGSTVTYNWTAPDKPGTFTVMCAYHPQMKFSLVVQ